MKKKSNRVLKILLFLLIAALLFCVLVFAEDRLSARKGKNPFSSILLDADMRKSLGTLERMDDNGNLYYIEYSADYYTPFFRIFKAALEKTGCSAFIARTPAGEVLTARNYDFPHKDKDGNLTGLNIVVQLQPEGKYKSVNIADAALISVIGFNYFTGALDDGKTDLTPLVLIPYLCVDGMNEKGLTASILSLDLKEGETSVRQNEKGKTRLTVNYLVRYLLDNCATVEEAVAMTKQYNIVSVFKSDFHVFVTDASGKSAVLEWRNNKLTVTETDAVSNFYVAFDDGEDSYKEGQLREKYEKSELAEGKYHYGYGHGYDRMNLILEMCSGRRDKNGTIKMSKNECFGVLSATAQDYNGDLTSYTQYSVIYNSTHKTADITVQKDFSSHYYFAL